MLICNRCILDNTCIYCKNVKNRKLRNFIRNLSELITQVPELIQGNLIKGDYSELRKYPNNPVNHHVDNCNS